MNRRTLIIILIIIFIATVFIFFFFKNNQLKINISINDNKEAPKVNQQAPVNTPYPAISAPVTTEAELATAPTEQAAPSTTAISQTSPSSTPVKSTVAILFTIQNEQGKPMKGIICALKTSYKDSTRMMPVTSRTSDSSGKCQFTNLDSANPYLVRVYWTKDQSRVSDVSLSYITPGTTETRVVVKPAGY